MLYHLHLHTLQKKHYFCYSIVVIITIPPHLPHRCKKCANLINRPIRRYHFIYNNNNFDVKKEEFFCFFAMWRVTMKERNVLRRHYFTQVTTMSDKRLHCQRRDRVMQSRCVTWHDFGTHIFKLFYNYCVPIQKSGEKCVVVLGRKWGKNWLKKYRKGKIIRNIWLDFDVLTSSIFGVFSNIL